MIFIPLRLLFIGVIVFVLLSITGCVERLVYFPMRGTPAPPGGLAVEEVRFPSADSELSLHGWFLPAAAVPESHSSVPDGSAADAGAVADRQPADAVLTRRPTILMLHGNAGNVSHHVAFVEFLPEAGFNVLVWDYRSYGRSDRGKLRREALMEDARGALAYVRSRPDVDPDRIAIFGHSLGSMFGLALLAEDQALRGGVFLSPFSSLPDAAASVLSPVEPPGAVARFVGRALLGHGLDPAVSIARLFPHQRVMVVHGDQDEVVPFAHGQRVAAAGTASGVDVKFRPVPGGDHNSLRWQEPALDRDISEFLQIVLRVP